MCRARTILDFGDQFFTLLSTSLSPVASAVLICFPTLCQAARFHVLLDEFPFEDHLAFVIVREGGAIRFENPQQIFERTLAWRRTGWVNLIVPEGSSMSSSAADLSVLTSPRTSAADSPRRFEAGDSAGSSALSQTRGSAANVIRNDVGQVVTRLRMSVSSVASAVLIVHRLFHRIDSRHFVDPDVPLGPSQRFFRQAQHEPNREAAVSNLAGRALPLPRSSVPRLPALWAGIGFCPRRLGPGREEPLDRYQTTPDSPELGHVNRRVDSRPIDLRRRKINLNSEVRVGVILDNVRPPRR